MHNFISGNTSGSISPAAVCSMNDKYVQEVNDYVESKGAMSKDELSPEAKQVVENMISGGNHVRTLIEWEELKQLIDNIDWSKPEQDL